MAIANLYGQIEIAALALPPGLSLSQPPAFGGDRLKPFLSERGWELFWRRA